MIFSSLYWRTVILSVFALTLFLPITAGAAPLEKVPADTRCPVCGMFVAKYDVWLTQIHFEDGTVSSFDGVKDMMAYYLEPTLYNGSAQAKIVEVWVKDYYSLKWLDARQAFFVIGSDVNGPMGHELIPFSIKAAAESFLVDHHGRQILTFAEITGEIIGQLRVGNRMKNVKK